MLDARDSIKRLHIYSINAGIILYETLVAVVVISVCISVAMGAFSSALKTTHMMEYYLKANTLIQNKFAEYHLFPLIQEGEYEGSFNEEPLFFWKATIEELSPVSEMSEDEETQEQLLLYSISIEILWTFSGKRKKISMDSILMKKVQTDGEDI